MPEFPEVETLRCALEEAVGNEVISHIEVHQKKLRAIIPENIYSLEGAQIREVGRRSKYLYFALDVGEAIISHMGMSGAWILNPEHRKHDHFVLKFSNGLRLAFNDPRKFGLIDMYPVNDLDHYRLFCNLGVECFDKSNMTAEYLYKAAIHSSRSLKSFLMDQRIIAGLGNIYVCESLWLSGLSPYRLSQSVNISGFRVLVGAIMQILEDALKAGGSSIKDFRDISGNLGKFQFNFSVYGRSGMHCKRNGCLGIIEREVQHQRASFFCPVCQK